MVLAQWFEREVGQWLAPDHNYQPQPDAMDTRSSLWQAVAPDPQFVETQQQQQQQPQGPPRHAFDQHERQPTTKCVHCQLETPILWTAAQSPQISGDSNNNMVTFDPITTRTHTRSSRNSDFSSDSSNTPYQTPSKEYDGDDEDEPGPIGIFLSPTPQQSRQRKSLGSNLGNTPAVATPDQKSRVLANNNNNVTPLELEILRASSDTSFMPQRNAKFRDQASKLLQYCSSTGQLREKALKMIDKLLQMNQSRLVTTDHNEPNLLTQARSFNMGMSCPDGLTPLLAAAKSNQVSAAQVLLQFAHDLNLKQELLEQTNLYGQTALHLASIYGHVEMVEYLQQQQQQSLGKGDHHATPFESPPAQDMTGQSAWSAAMTSPNPKARSYRKTLDRLLSASSMSPHALSGGPVRPIVYPAPQLQLQYATAHLDGRRIFNEDALRCQWLPELSSMLFLVCDGHGDCGSVAHFMAQHLPATLVELSKGGGSDSREEQDDYWKNLCQSAAAQLDVRLKKAHLSGGCTAVWAIVTPTQIVVANVGDSRCILVQTQDQVQALSWDHKPDLPEERARIEQAGLTVVLETYTATPTQEQQDEEDKDEVKAAATQIIAKVQLSEMNQLGVSRAFGDFEYKKVSSDSDVDEKEIPTAVICSPDVQVVSRQADRDLYLVLACDGIWDVQSNEDVSRMIRQKRAESKDLATTGHELLKECLHSDDNLSVILVAFDGAVSKEEPSVILEEKLQELTLQETQESVSETEATPVKALDFSPEKSAGTSTGEN